MTTEELLEEAYELLQSAHYDGIDKGNARSWGQRRRRFQDAVIEGRGVCPDCRHGLGDHEVLGPRLLTCDDDGCEDHDQCVVDEAVVQAVEKGYEA